MSTEWLLAAEALIWLVAIGLVVARQDRLRAESVGLVLAYVLNLWLIHWPGAALYLLPWYSNLTADVVEAGFRQSTYAVVAFTVGGVFLAPFLMNRHSPAPAAGAPVRLPAERLDAMYALWGLFSYLVLIPLVGQAPTTTAVVVAGWNMLAVGLGLGCWRAWCERRRLGLVGLLLLVGCLPLVTIVSQGYLGYGTGAVLAVLTLVKTFQRWPRARLLVLAVLFGYVALSFYGSYMRDRSQIRAVVWGGDSLAERVGQVYYTVSTFEWFDPYDNAHLIRIDDRLNQNLLVGTAVDYLDAQLADFAAGETLWQAVLALVPRAAWPSKPVVAGSMDIVSRYTGFSYPEGTSVGVGQVMELYINFGTLGIACWFLGLGVLLGAVDAIARRRLVAGDWPRFALWYMPGLSALQVGWSLVDVTSSAGAAVVNVLFVNHVLVRLFRGRIVRPRPAPLATRAAAPAADRPRA